jgi:hypothetical protein
VEGEVIPGRMTNGDGALKLQFWDGNLEVKHS